MQLFCELSRGPFARHSHQCRMSITRIFMCHELVAKDLTCSKFYANCLPKYVVRLSHDCHATVERQSYDLCASVTNQCPREILANLQCEKFRDTYKCRKKVLRKHANNLRLSGEKIKLRDICTNVLRHPQECLAIVVQMKMQLKPHSWERHETL